MFISSMARKNMEKQKELQESSSGSYLKKKKLRNELSITGEKPVMSQKGFNFHYSTRKHGRSLSAPVSSGTAPTSNVEFLLDKNSSFHMQELQLDPEEFGLAIDLEDIDNNTIRQEDVGGTGWFLNPVHRPTDSSFQFSELVQRKPLAASVMKATAEGTLQRDYVEDISETPLCSFDMDIFKETDMRFHKEEIRKSLKLRSPYELELAKLKHEKLKLEEAYLLKLKCKAELEETRGPRPKWYELKTKNFNREIRKYNNLLRSSGNWKDLIEYRNDLIEASGRWENLRQ